MPEYRAKPITIRDAKAFVRKHHRHRKIFTGGLFAIAATRADDPEGKIVAVAVVGRPSAPMLQDGRTAEIIRVAAPEGHRNACSWLLGRARRVLAQLGYERVLTYTGTDEPGASLRGAGFRLVGTTKGGSWSRKGRTSKPGDGKPKHRWEADHA